ncbi:kinase-like domain-containing protein [Zalerion maritima]|uniref:Kinase-like domain-containing protein n=1 Tax=Zalerion maritima TaxID=339359 RepID=A0AAD5S0C3_9PEZI|nr:kinase-like domain-containing protein [Zalerion maritima]
MASTIVGKSGRVYIQGEVLQRPREDHKLSMFKAESGNGSFVFKRVPRPFYHLSLRLAAEFAGSCRLRMPVDCNQGEGVLVYPYFQKHPTCLDSGRSWLSSGGTKENPATFNWTCDNERNNTVTNVALGDFDVAFKSEGGEPRQTPYAIGNAMWRSPEGQAGRGATKASDVFSFEYHKLLAPS